jgi:asparagine synthase (glutamine-hydrolysing)
MCGIAGFLGTSGFSSNRESTLHSMTDRLFHRGPDSAGFYFDPPVGLGMRRLSIIDLNTGDQPISNEDRTVWTVFNGEIYNYAELRRKLQKRGHVFRTDSDTEVIVHQYEEDGENFAAQLRGMFAIAVWDTKRRLLTLARDRFGIKPLFVAENGGEITFASEMKALLPLDRVDCSWNPVALRAYFSLGYIPCPMTGYKGIRKFRQGTVEVWGIDPSGHVTKTSSHRYWEPSAAVREPVPSFDDASAQVLDLLEESIRLHLRSDVPLGAFLSGGIDSSSVVALTRHAGIDNIKTFSIGFDSPAFNELPYADKVAGRLQTDHHSHVITGLEVCDLIPLLTKFDEPFADSSAIPTYFVSRLARDYVTVSLSGDGGDELFAGYSQYPQIQRYQLVDWIPDPIRSLLSKTGSVFIPEQSRGGGFVRRLGVPIRERLLSLESSPLHGLLLEALSVPFRSFLSEDAPDSAWQENYWCANSVPAAQIVDQTSYMADDILVKVDLCSMAVSLEARVPLLDHVLADYVNGLPHSYKLANGNGKRILKETLKPFLPHDVLFRPKQGFAIPLRPWLLGPLQPNVKALLIDNPYRLFDPAGISAVLRALEIGERDLSKHVWKMLCLAIWADQHRNRIPF